MIYIHDDHVCNGTSFPFSKFSFSGPTIINKIKLDEDDDGGTTKADTNGAKNYTHNDCDNGTVMIAMMMHMNVLLSHGNVL